MRSINYIILFCLSVNTCGATFEKDLIEFIENKNVKKFVVHDSEYELRIPRSLFDFHWNEAFVPMSKLPAKQKIKSTDKIRNVIFLKLSEKGQVLSSIGKELDIVNLVNLLSENSKLENPTVVLFITDKSMSPDPLFFTLLEKYSHKLSIRVGNSSKD